MRTLLFGALPAAALLAAAACSSPGSPGGAGGPPPCTFTNPVTVGADPWILRQGAAYYFIQSTGNAISVQKVSKLTDIGGFGVTVWSAPASGWNQTNVWAPELHYIDNHWYIYYAAGSAGPPFIYQRSGVLAATTADPQGPYIDKGMLYTGDSVATGANNIWAIDLTVERLGGQLYAVWSGWDQNATTDRTQQNLYIARMSDPATISSNRVKISSPTEGWELGTQLNLQEGPEFLQHAGQVFIIYSTRESWLKDYRLGQLRLTSGADPMNPASWVKSGPVFTGTATVYGVGHASYTTSPDSTEDWIAYHSKVDSTPGWDRRVRLQKFSWNADGSPAFGIPVPSGQAIPEPSGQCR